ncbi:MAG: beta-ketoacyl-ACP synthase II [Polyangiaceae bacterium]|nr:beta-ketoacyl-ACP synthase II [Polyangiaceae bacterium]MCW5791883.1 beta-ketoacyl-ACP synthase II [Polyangiaceae bacterium]
MERVVITGLGLVTPNGIGTDATWQSLLRAESSADTITQFEVTGDYPSRFACEVKGYEPGDFMPRKKLKEVARFITFAMGATRMALQDAGLELSEEERDRAGCFIGVGLGGLENLERVKMILEEKGPGKVSPYFIPSLIGNLAAGQVSIEYGLRGPSFCHTTACSSSAHSIGEAAEWIRRGKADVMIAGGAEATITPIGIAGFSAMFALSRRNDDPKAASRPWDKGRDGFVCGEGAGTLVLESLSRAQRRGARIYAEVTGFGASSDAYHITKPAPDGAGAIRSMRLALEDARLNPEQIGYMNAHGTSTPAGDIEESKAVEQVFGAHATDHQLWVSSTKSMMGHLLGAAGAVEAAVCAKAIETGAIPPTINLTDPDPACRLDYVPNAARERRLDHVMSNSFGFGGTNATLILSRFA